MMMSHNLGLVSMLIYILAKKATLKGERVHNIKLFENDDSAACFFAWFDLETALFNVKEFILLTAH